MSLWNSMDPIFGVISSRGLACPKSLTNRCETQYFDGKKGKCHSAMSLRITMHRHIFSTKWGQNSNFSPSLWHTVLIRVANCDVRTVGIFPLTYVNSKLAFSLFPQFIGGTNFHLWIVRSGENFDWIFCGGHGFHFVHFPIIEKNGIVKLAARKYRNLQQQGEKVIVVRFFF